MSTVAVTPDTGGYVKIHGRWIRLFLLVSVPALCPLALPVPAWAANCFEQASTNFHAGYIESDSKLTSGYDYEGVSLLLTARAGAFCSGQNGTNATAAWGGIAETGYGGAHMQSGNVHFPGTVIEEYAEDIEPDGMTYRRYGAGLTPGQRIGYRSVYSAACGCIQGKADGIVLLSTLVNPYAAGQWQWPFTVQFLSETWWYEDDIPGTSTGHAIYSGLGVQNATTDNLMVIPCNLMTTFNDKTNPPAGQHGWFVQYDACDQFETYAQ